MTLTPRVFLLLVFAAAVGCSKKPAADEHGHEAADAGHVDDDKPKAGSEGEDAHANKAGHEEGEAHGATDDHDQINLTEAQIRVAGITVATVGVGLSAGGAINAPAVVAADPSRSAVVSAAVSGRVVSLPRNIGERVSGGDTLAVIESREAAELRAELEAARQHLALARSVLRREERLFRERVSPEQDVIAARTGAAEAQIRVRLADQRLGATGGTSVGPLNRLVVRSPLRGHVVSRSAELGSVVQADAELFRVADLSTVALEIALLPDAAADVTAGAPVTITTSGREGSGRIEFVSPVIDPRTRQVRATATLSNPDGRWRIGETVQVSIPMRGAGADSTLTVPRAAIQTVEGKPSAFVRIPEGFRVTHLVTGPASGDSIVVVSGLKAGERIAVTNTFVLKAEAGKGEGGHEH
ncbi:MAG: efflux RND transporter periplasmic adaptor subunit [Gammaproteobacteria bacterium]|nr:efflux RND transporter periplasmic adaptor subunit [Gammaproteobacteria bacterium]